MPREYHRGTVAYDARADLQMTSEVIASLSHTGSAIVGGFQLRYRIPATDDYLDLFYRRDVKYVTPRGVRAAPYSSTRM